MSLNNEEVMPERKYVYRVEFTGRQATVSKFEVASTTPELDGEYYIDDLPDWMQRRIAVLSGMSYEPPTEYVAGIGRRIEKDVYWVFYGEDEENDDER
tara:strand:+ start:131 stop:424 length:294 start_codon:yes stop_codon:yes gene_type:complete